MIYTIIFGVVLLLQSITIYNLKKRIITLELDELKILLINHSILEKLEKINKK